MFIQDDFEGSSQGTLLENHSTPQNQDYIKQSSGGSAEITSVGAFPSGQRHTLIGHSTDWGTYRVDTVPPSNDYDLEATIRFSGIAGANYAGVLGRIQGNGQGIFAGYNGFEKRWEVNTRDANGSFISGGSVGTFSQEINTNQDYDIRVEFRGNSIDFYVNEVLRISGTHGLNFEEGHVGVLIRHWQSLMRWWSAEAVDPVPSDPPGKPEIGNAITLSDRSIQLTSLVAGSNADEHELRFNKGDSDDPDAVLETIIEFFGSTVPSEFIKHDLDPASTYIIFLRAINEDGHTDSDSVQETTFPGDYLFTIVPGGDPVLVSLGTSLIEIDTINYSIGKFESEGTGQVDIKVEFLLDGSVVDDWTHVDVGLEPQQHSHQVGPYTDPINPQIRVTRLQVT